MPAWTPPLDLRFDYAANAAAVAQVGITIGFLGVLSDAEESALATARRGWVGTANRLAEARMATHFALLRDAQAQLSRLREDLGQAADDASVEQRRRDALQHEWASEREAEESDSLATESGPR